MAKKPKVTLFPVARVELFDANGDKWGVFDDADDDYGPRYCEVCGKVVRDGHEHKDGDRHICLGCAVVDPVAPDGLDTN